MADLKALDELDQWPKLRKKIETSVKSILQMPVNSSVEPQVKVMDEFSDAGYTRRRINYFVDDWSRISAWLLVPDGATEEPAIICMHRQTSPRKTAPRRSKPTTAPDDAARRAARRRPDRPPCLAAA